MKFSAASLLLLEDEPLLRRQLGAHWEKLGGAVTLVGTLAEARPALRNLEFDFALLDVNLPDGRCLELLQEKGGRECGQCGDDGGGGAWRGAVAGTTGRLVNLLVRTNAGKESDTLIVGFVVAGAAMRSLLVRGVGPTLVAFALGAGSQDGALVLTLPPGAYTAQVSGVGNATGVGLVEVYEVP
jgi:hypothetical protein